MPDLDIRCGCGTVRGVAHAISPDCGNRCVCYCKDCQSFAHFLGRAAEVLDAHGGTDILQMSPARLEITAGREQLACMRLTAKGLYRWYAACCKTPLGNTLPTHQVPFIGLILACIERASPGASLDNVLGPVRARVHGLSAKGDVSGLGVHDRAPVGMLLGVAGMLVAARLRGDHRRSPLFDAQTGTPIAMPRVLDEDELHAVEHARDARA